MKKYCECKDGLILANLETGKGECPICKKPKKLNKRLENMSKVYNEKDERHYSSWISNYRLIWRWIKHNDCIGSSTYNANPT